MSSVNDPTKTDGYLKSCTRLVAFRLPICKPTLDYHASFKSSLGTPEAMQLIQSLSEARGGMVSAYQSSGSFEVKIKAAEDYIPLLYQLLDTMQNSPKLRLDKDLTFEWQGGICNKGEFFKSHDALYELIMVLHAKVKDGVIISSSTCILDVHADLLFLYRLCTTLWPLLTLSLQTLWHF